MPRPRRKPTPPKHITIAGREQRAEQTAKREQRPAGIEPPKAMTNGSGANTPLPDVDYR